MVTLPADHLVTLSAGVVGGFSLKLTFILFVSVVVVTMFTALITAPQGDEISEFYLGNRAMSPLRNGLAMCGDYLSAATLLGSTGLVALTGYDGLLYLVGTSVAWVMVLLLIAEPLRNSGKFTLGDTLALRLPAQAALRPPGARLLHADHRRALPRGPTRRQRRPADAVRRPARQHHPHPVRGGHRHPGRAVRGTRRYARRDLHPDRQGGHAGRRSRGDRRHGAAPLQLERRRSARPRRLRQRHGAAVSWSPDCATAASTSTSKLDFFSLQIAIVLGLAALPHVMMRLLAPNSTRVLRRSILWAMGLVGFVCLAAGVLVSARRRSSAGRSSRASTRRGTRRCCCSPRTSAAPSSSR